MLPPRLPAVALALALTAAAAAAPPPRGEAVSEAPREARGGVEWGECVSVSGT